VVNVTVEPEIEQTLEVDASMVSVTGNPALEEAEATYDPPIPAPVGGVEVKVMDWDPGPMPDTVCCTWVAEEKSTLPLWLASIVQLPTAVNVTVAPEMVQLAVVEASMVSDTGNPDDELVVTA
jgi:hypothetical protein